MNQTREQDAIDLLFRIKASILFDRNVAGSSLPLPIGLQEDILEFFYNDQKGEKV